MAHTLKLRQRNRTSKNPTIAQTLVLSQGGPKSVSSVHSALVGNKKEKAVGLRLQDIYYLRKVMELLNIRSMNLIVRGMGQVLIHCEVSLIPRSRHI